MSSVTVLPYCSIDSIQMPLLARSYLDLLWQIYHGNQEGSYVVHKAFIVLTWLQASMGSALQGAIFCATCLFFLFDRLQWIVTGGVWVAETSSASSSAAHLSSSFAHSFILWVC